MKSSIRIGMVLLTAVIGAATVTARGDSYVGFAKQWTVVNFRDPVLVKGQFVSGPVLIVHDSLKMSRGEACTTFYRFDKAQGQQEEIVSFHCKPRMTDARAETTQLVTTTSPDIACRRLVEYQIAGDEEAHGVPAK
jgi:hypothetical protein